jgi:hypothetical protein
MPKALLAKIKHSDPELLVAMVFTRNDDSEDRTFFRGFTTGEEVTNPIHGVQVRSRSLWIETELLIESWMSLRGREVHFRDFWSLSPDGRTLTMEHRNDDLAGQITRMEKVLQQAA